MCELVYALFSSENKEKKKGKKKKRKKKKKKADWGNEVKLNEAGRQKLEKQISRQ